MRIREALIDDALSTIRREIGLTRDQEIIVERALERLADLAHEPPRRRDRQGHFEEQPEW